MALCYRSFFVSRALLTALLLAGAVAVTLGVMWALQRRLIYFPVARVPAPRVVGLAGVEEVSFVGADRVRLNGWFIPPPSRQAVTIIVFNGNAGNRAMRTGLASALAGRNLGVLLFDYRGFGGNSGTPTEHGLTIDAVAARQYVAMRPDADPARIVYFGESLGAAVALRLACDFPPAAVVLRSPFSSLAALAAVHYPIVPAARLLLRDKFSSIDVVARIRSPLLVVAGDRDTIVPLSDSRRLFDAARESKELVTIAGADHNDRALAEGLPLINAVMNFLHAQKLT
jgi:uncharacterized protein